MQLKLNNLCEKSLERISGLSIYACIDPFDAATTSEPADIRFGNAHDGIFGKTVAVTMCDPLTQSNSLLPLA